MSERKVLSVEEMLSPSDVEYVEIEAWGGIVRIGSLTAEDLIEWTEANEGPAKKTAAIRLIVRSLVDEQGNRIGTDKHIEAFKKRSHATMERIAEQVLKLNGMHLNFEKIKNA